MAKTKVK